ncbi:MAG: hypothetical protein ABI954_00105 [Pyrinomonadaceae bacterium]
MLRCPKCSCVYQDDTQKFCIKDGARILPVDESLEQMPSHKLPRRTPPGELLLETFISPSDDISFESVAQFNRSSTPSFQSFGIHSSHTLDTMREVKATNGFHSFDSLIVDNKETRIAKTQVASNSNALPHDSLIHVNGNNQVKKVSASFIIVCLLGALLFLTVLAFAATYFFREQGQIPAHPIGETTFTTNSTTGKVVVLPSSYLSFRSRRYLKQTKVNVLRVIILTD